MQTSNKTKTHKKKKKKKKKKKFKKERRKDRNSNAWVWRSKEAKASCSNCFWLQQWSCSFFFLFFSKLCLFIYYNSLNELNVKAIQIFKDSHYVLYSKYNFVVVVVWFLGNVFLLTVFPDKKVMWGEERTLRMEEVLEHLIDQRRLMVFFHAST